MKRLLILGIFWLVTAGVVPAQTNAPVLADFSRLQAELKSRTPLTWVITGDSITQGAKWLGRERSYPEIIQERVRWEMRRLHDLVINSGVSGDQAPGLLADFDWRVVRFKPDIVSVMMGMNDCPQGAAGHEKFAAALREIVHRIRTAGAIPILNRTNPVDTEPEGRYGDLPAYNKIIAQVAASENVILVDHWQYWQEARPDLISLREWLANPIHPNAAGHRQFAILFFKTLGIYDDKSPACQP